MMVGATSWSCLGEAWIFSDPPTGSLSGSALAYQDRLAPMSSCARSLADAGEPGVNRRYAPQAGAVLLILAASSIDKVRAEVRRRGLPLTLRAPPNVFLVLTSSPDAGAVGLSVFFGEPPSERRSRSNSRPHDTGIYRSESAAH